MGDTRNIHFIVPIPELNPTTALAGTQVVDRYLSTALRPLLAQVPTDRPAPRTIAGLTCRAIALIQGLARLDKPSHLQLVLAANRAMLELLVDVLLLASDHADARAEQLEAWELSARFAAASATIEYVKGHGGLTELEQPLQNFISRERDRVTEYRRRYWTDSKGKPRHPSRWTGRDLLQDVRLADEAGGPELERFYETEYRRINWQVHGSTLAGNRGLDPSVFGVWYAFGHRKTSDLSLTLAEISMRGLDLLNPPARQALASARQTSTLVAGGLSWLGC